MLTSRRKKQVAAIIVIGGCAALFLWWASCGYPTEEPYCKPPPEDYDCPSYNIFVYVAVRILDVFNYYGTAIATGVIAWFTYVLVTIGKRADIHFRVSERAYVKLSHIGPGIYWEYPRPEDNRYARDKKRWMHIDLQATNSGRTPADVRNICVAKSIVEKDARLPEVPDYSIGSVDNSASAFLVSDDRFLHMVRLECSTDEMWEIISGNKWLYIFGYVEYLDKFGSRHRAGYARRYDKGRDASPAPDFATGTDFQRPEGVNNLIFVDQSGYNFDITQNADGTWPKS